MLVLTRKTDETIVLRLGTVRVEVTVTAARPDKVQLGFTAPDEVVIFRKELEHIPEFGGDVSNNT